MNLTAKANEYFVQFDSLNDYADYLRNYLRPNSHVAQRACEPGFSEYTYKQAFEMLVKGWTDGVKKIDAIKDEINARTNEEIEKTVSIDFDVTGEFIDMGRVMTGEPECFGQITLSENTKETVTIRVISSMPCNVDVKSIYNRGAVIMSVIEKLREKYHVVIEIMQNIKGLRDRNDRSCSLTGSILIDTERDFSRDGLAFCVANASFNRRLEFAVTESALGVDSCAAEGYGYPEENHPKGKNVLYFGTARNEGYRTIADSVETTKKVLADYESARIADKGGAL